MACFSNLKTEKQKQIEARLRVIEDFQEQVNMLRKQREALKCFSATNIEDHWAHYDEIIEALENRIKQLRKEIERFHEKDARNQSINGA